MTSLSLTLKQNGARSITTIIKLNASTHITSKTSEENLIFSNTTQNYVKTGKVEHLLLVTKKGAKGLSSALFPTVGKSNNFTHSYIRPNNVRK